MKLKYDEPLFNIAFDFNLYLYSEGANIALWWCPAEVEAGVGMGAGAGAVDSGAGAGLVGREDWPWPTPPPPASGGGGIPGPFQLPIARLAL